MAIPRKSFGFGTFAAVLLVIVTFNAHICSGSLYQPPPLLFKFHSQEMLQGDIPVSIVWYGKFTSHQKSIIHDFLFSITPNRATVESIPPPSVSQWWEMVDNYVQKAGLNKTHVLLANQINDNTYSLGKRLSKSNIATLAGRVSSIEDSIALVLTDHNVAVTGFCTSNCGFHSSISGKRKLVYIWIGNSATQCPGNCAWPFHQPIYGPQVPPLVPPNRDVGMDGMVINLGTLMAGAVTNPYGDGFFQGTKEAPVEVAGACPGIYAKGGYPGYAGDLLVDRSSGGSFNAHGLDGRRFLLPTMFNTSSLSCSFLV